MITPISSLIVGIPTMLYVWGNAFLENSNACSVETLAFNMSEYIAQNAFITTSEAISSISILPISIKQSAKSAPMA